MRTLEDKVAIVTGAGQGVGRGIALALAAEGARVLVSGRTVEKCDAVAAEITARGGAAVAVRCDTTSRSDVDACVELALRKWERIDIVVNAAQTQKYGALRRLSEEDMEGMWQSGPMGALRFMQACLPHLRESRGCVVNVGSGSSITAPAAMGGYAMVKEAMRVLSRVGAVEWGRYGVRVNTICPLADSPGFESFKSTVPGDVGKLVLDAIPLGRVGEAERDIGRAVVFLCGPDAEYITGTTLMVDGGYTYLR